MTLRQRLARIQTSLTPKQAVLLWLKEVQHLENDDFLEKSCKCPMHEAPRVRVPEMAAKAVRDSLSTKGTKPELIARAELEAWKQADFLVVLVLKLNEEVLQNCQQSSPYLAFLWVQLRWMGAQFDEHGVFNATEWDHWRELLIDTLSRMWVLRATITAVSEQYYDCHSVLLLDQESSLNQCIEGAEVLAKVYNNLEGIGPSWTAIDLVTLQSSIEAQVPATVCERVAGAKASTLRAIGEWKAAWDLVEPYVLASIEKPRASSSLGNGQVGLASRSPEGVQACRPGERSAITMIGRI
jgi:hypothetical protein